MMNTNNTIQSNGVNERESNARSVSPGRQPVVNQAGAGRHLTTGEARPAAQRMSFTREDNIKIVECYYSSEPAVRGYMTRMAKIWQDRGGFELTENRLAMQARTILRKEWLTKEELDEIRKRETEDQSKQTTEEGQVAVEVIPPILPEEIHVQYTMVEVVNITSK